MYQLVLNYYHEKEFPDCKKILTGHSASFSGDAANTSCRKSRIRTDRRKILPETIVNFVIHCSTPV